jgi:hypothetical protein
MCSRLLASLGLSFALRYPLLFLFCAAKVRRKSRKGAKNMLNNIENALFFDLSQENQPSRDFLTYVGSQANFRVPKYNLLH